MSADGFRKRLETNFDARAEAVALSLYDPETHETTEDTWQQLSHRIDDLALKLSAAGVGPGDFVCMISKTSLDLIASFLAAVRMGAVCSIFPPPSALHDRRYYITQQIRSLGVIAPRHVVLFETPPEFLEELVRALPGVNVVQLSDAICANSGSAQIWRAAGNHEIFVQHSSGTTGIKKGVSIRDDVLGLHLDAYGRLLGLDSAIASEPPVIASWLPLYHDMGLVACLLLSLYWGGSLHMIDPFQWVASPSLLFDLIAKRRAQLVWLPNFAFRFLSRSHPRGARQDLSSVRLWVNCSEPCRLETLDEFATKFAPNGVSSDRLACCYAMAETVFAVSQTPRGEAPGHLRVKRSGMALGRPVEFDNSPENLAVMSNGPALPGVEVRVRNTIWEPEGTLGELCVKAPFMFDGYYRRPDLADEVFVDGYYRTGDIGFVRDGEIYVTGRMKEIIIVHGKNIFATDVEAIANETRGIKGGRCVAFGIESGQSGSEELVVVAERDPAAWRPDAEIKSAISVRITLEFGIHPADVVITDERWLIKSTSGKISRGENLQKYLDLCRNGHS